MRKTRAGLLGLSAALLFWSGCQTPESNVKPKLVEQYNLPPADDPRFSSPPSFPKETLNVPPPPRRDPSMPSPAFPRGGPGRAGMPSGIGGY